MMKRIVLAALVLVMMVSLTSCTSLLALWPDVQPPADPSASMLVVEAEREFEVIQGVCLTRILPGGLRGSSMSRVILWRSSPSISNPGSTHSFMLRI
jgi:hypothetical protein